MFDPQPTNVKELGAHDTTPLSGGNVQRRSVDGESHDSRGPREGKVKAMIHGAAARGSHRQQQTYIYLFLPHATFVADGWRAAPLLSVFCGG